MKARVVQDVSGLPPHAYGKRMTMWWGTMYLMAIEGTALALAAGSYIYLAARNPQWPTDAPAPGLLWSTIMTVLLLASLVPTFMLKTTVKTEDKNKIRLLLIVLSAVGLATLIVRGLEFTSLNVRWDQNAYGSIVWFIIVMHTTHLVVDVIDTWVLTVMMFTKHARGKRYSDAESDAIFWYFVIAAWVPLYGLVYWFPRLWGSA